MVRGVGALAIAGTTAAAVPATGRRSGRYCMTQASKVGRSGAMPSEAGKNALSAAGSHEVIDAVADCERSIDAIEARIRKGEQP